MSYKISIISLGCSKNLIDSEIMMGILQQGKFQLIDEPENSEIIIVNTCGFIESAKEESVDSILEAAQYKKTGKCAILIVSGCLSERYKDELMKEIPEIDAIVGTGNITEIIDIIKDSFLGKKPVRVGNVDISFDENLPRISSTPHYTSYVKIAEGCDNFCTYCIIPKLRGRFRSRKIESIVSEVERLAQTGVKEIILIAQDTSKYGIDIYGEFKLPELLNRLSNITNIAWIRILYIYPETFTEELIQSIKENDKVVKYVDIPIQHVSDKVLKKMNRSTSKEMITKLVNKLRSEIPEIVLRTTMIVGFPGETEDDFEEIYEYVKETKFDRLGVFTYSLEEGTPAAKMNEQIEESTKLHRQEQIMELQKQISSCINKEKIGRYLDVLIEEFLEEEDIYTGRTYMDSPEIDGIVYVHSKKSLDIGSIVKVKITDSLEYDLMGEI